MFSQSLSAMSHDVTQLRFPLIDVFNADRLRFVQSRFVSSAKMCSSKTLLELLKSCITEIEEVPLLIAVGHHE